jgi:hypothetical protein
MPWYRHDRTRRRPDSGFSVSHYKPWLPWRLTLRGIRRVPDRVVINDHERERLFVLPYIWTIPPNFAHILVDEQGEPRTDAIDIVTILRNEEPKPFNPEGTIRKLHLNREEEQ